MVDMLERRTGSTQTEATDQLMVEIDAYIAQSLEFLRQFPERRLGEVALTTPSEVNYADATYDLIYEEGFSITSYFIEKT